nr:MAG: maturation protein [Hangzhou steitz-like virus 1]
MDTPRKVTMIKSRRIACPSVILGSTWDRNLNQYTYYSYIPDFLEERVDTTNHPLWFAQDDGGGFFDQQITEYRSGAQLGNVVAAPAGGGNPFLRYEGGFSCSVPVSAMPTGNGQAWGATAYKAMKPTKPDYSLLNMVYELRELPSMLIRLKDFWDLELFRGAKNFSRESSSRFLGQVFGWNPLINDVMSVIKAQQKIQKRIEWLIRNNGKWKRRRIVLFDNIAMTNGDWINDYGALNPVLTTGHYLKQPRYRDTTWTRDRVWATAEFRYFLPDVPTGVSPGWYLKRCLSGFRSPSIADLYRAIPWTWLVDWCLNLANVLENTDPGVADRLAARRFYIMREQEVVKTRHADAVMRAIDGSAVPVQVTAWRRDLHRTRLLGNPFYPGNPNNLSGMQLAILGALGLSRL